MILALALSLCACGNEAKEDNHATVAPQDQTTLAPTQASATVATQASNKTQISFPSEDLATQCMRSILQAKNAEDLDAYLTEATKEKTGMLLEHYPDGEADITIRHAKQHKNYDIFYYTISYKDVDFKEENMTVLYRGKDGYQLCLEDAVNQEIVAAYTCAQCGGGGQTMTGAPLACGICSGSGWQWIPNAYFDPALNMWMGQNVGCGGCGGSGYISGANKVTCTGCGGLGLKF